MVPPGAGQARQGAAGLGAGIVGQLAQRLFGSDTGGVGGDQALQLRRLAVGQQQGDLGLGRQTTQTGAGGAQGADAGQPQGQLLPLVRLGLAAGAADAALGAVPAGGRL
jgi:hypothetical protein